MLSREVKLYLRSVFTHIYLSVNPKELISSQIIVIDNKLVINNKPFHIKSNCYIVGFGKAVYDMGCEVAKILKHHFIKGVLSVPKGSLNDTSVPNNFKVFEGAENNIPDKMSLRATQEIFNLVESLNENDLLLVLISGGGSALLAAPLSPVTLEEKIATTKLLARSGASIRELNSVRKPLSKVKGGRLMEKAYPCTVLSLILSDVIDDPLDIIASGPTVITTDTPQSALNVIEKYSLKHKVPPNVLSVLTRHQCEINPKIFERSHPFIIGSNKKALEAGKSFIEKNNGVCLQLSASLEGRVELVAQALGYFVFMSCKLANMMYSPSTDSLFLLECAKVLSITDETVRNVISLLSSCDKDIFFLFGGETTVSVSGNGLGGRNMELALRVSNKLQELSKNDIVFEQFEIGILCGGTDGIDGPTDAAGAISYPQQVALAESQGFSVSGYINNNDSYSFFKAFNDSDDLIVTGHTGTNVMDIIIIYIKRK